MPTALTRGAWILGTDTGITAAIAASGFDWIVLDQQHGRLGDSEMISLLAATEGGVPRWVRVRSLDDGLIGRALDAGAQGVVVPMVDSRAQAEQASRATRYPPRGARSWGPFAGGYSSPGEAPHSDMVCAVMIETAAALADVDSIAATAGVDMLFVGPFDLALALGVELDTLLLADGPDAPLHRIVDAAKRAGIKAGAFGGTPARAATLAALGFDTVAVASDTLLVQLGATAALA
ncbi:HpcH/HpaI aldolase/citrate lyase family protein [Amnibacterium flavum]|uniref:Aldolase n=1 Tax=Amnibacterium flavum TaxID=2173173 RepID=A0A2V1HYV7_9MICO|nr:aldolase/citrate lyase family protein [Amnibacterium flavum]PVZ96077.1 aldolase [Amnibacterium flavum]